MIATAMTLLAFASQPQLPGCLREPREFVVGQTSHAVVYSTKDGDARVCWKASGRTRRLNHEPTYERHDPNLNLTFAGRYAAYSWVEPVDTDDDEAGVELIDARRGRQFQLASDYGIVEQYDRVVVSARGSVAWTHGHTVRLCRRCFRSHAGSTLLAHDRSVDPFSLRRTGRFVSWVAGGRRRFAPLDRR